MHAGRSMEQKTVLTCFVAAIAIFIGELYIVSLPINIRTKLFRYQFLTVVEFVLFIGSRFIWRNFTIDFKRAKSRSPKQIQFSLVFKIWQFCVFVFLLLAQCSFVVISFLTGTNPHWFAVTCFVCLGFYVQLVFSLFCTNTLFWLHGKFLYHNTRSSSSQENSDTIKYFSRLILTLSYATAVICYGLHNTSLTPQVKTVNIEMDKLSPDSPPVNIVQLSDIHLGPTVGRDQLEKVVDVVNSINPEIIVLTGDLVDSSLENLADAVKPLENLHPKLGKYFVTGNHEYISGGVDEWFTYLRSLQFTVLHNENRRIQLHGTDTLCLAGVDDIEATRFKYDGHGMDLEKALRSCDRAHPIILLAHQPRAANVALHSKYSTNLILSGHTHGGQFFPASIGIYLWNPFYSGLYVVAEDSYVYVTQGTFYWGVPIRVGSSMEITHFVLTSSA